MHTGFEVAAGASRLGRHLKTRGQIVPALAFVIFQIANQRDFENEPLLLSTRDIARQLKSAI